MPDIEVAIGGRSFIVSCQPGEEHFLRSAASYLDAEAQPLIASMGRLPEVKMLLMAGLMLADRAAAQEDEMRQLRERIAALEDRPEPEAKRIEVPVIPPQVPQTLAELAARVDALADRIGEKADEITRSAGSGSQSGRALSGVPSTGRTVPAAADLTEEGFSFGPGDVGESRAEAAALAAGETAPEGVEAAKAETQRAEQ